MMILHGQADPLVPHPQSVLLYNALQARCETATFFSVPGAGHDWREVLDPALHESHAAFRTHRCDERITVGHADPTFANIERFLQRALSR